MDDAAWRLVSRERSSSLRPEAAAIDQLAVPGGEAGVSVGFEWKGCGCFEECEGMAMGVYLVRGLRGEKRRLGL